jgi:hypothetical protein
LIHADRDRGEPAAPRGRGSLAEHAAHLLARPDVPAVREENQPADPSARDPIQQGSRHGRSIESCPDKGAT